MLERTEERMDKDKKTKQCKHVSQLLEGNDSILRTCAECDVTRSTFNKWKTKQVMEEEI